METKTREASVQPPRDCPRFSAYRKLLLRLPLSSGTKTEVHFTWPLQNSNGVISPRRNTHLVSKALEANISFHCSPLFVWLAVIWQACEQCGASALERVRITVRPMEGLPISTLSGLAQKPSTRLLFAKMVFPKTVKSPGTQRVSRCLNLDMSNDSKFISEVPAAVANGSRWRDEQNMLGPLEDKYDDVSLKLNYPF